jgi:hypothetical protein
VYDVTRPETFDHINMWLSEVEVYSSQSNPVKMLVANKIDLVCFFCIQMGLSPPFYFRILFTIGCLPSVCTAP